MKAACWKGAREIAVEEVPDPEILNPRDIVVRVVVSGICGADLHLYHGLVPSMVKGDILGHEFAGEVVEVGRDVVTHRPGDRVVVASVIGCGGCFHCRRHEFGLCDNSNPNARLAEKVFGFAGAAVFGSSHLFGGYAGSDAEYVRVPFADVNAARIPDGVTYEQAVFASDTLPTGIVAAELCNIQPGDTVAVWGCGPVGQSAILGAHLLGANRVIAIDRVPSRLERASLSAKADVIDFRAVDVVEALADMTGGRGPDACIDAVGMEAEGRGLEGAYDRTKQAVRAETDRPGVLREAIRACRKGGTLAVVGSYTGYADKLPVGAALQKGLTVRMGRQHGQRYVHSLLDYMEDGVLDPSYLVTHRLPLEEAPTAFRMVEEMADECMKVLLVP